MLVDAYRRHVLATAAVEVTQRKLQLRRIRVVAHSLGKIIQRGIALVLQQVVQAAKVSARRTPILYAHLAKIKTRSQPAQNKGKGQYKQKPNQVKLHRWCLLLRIAPQR